MRDNDGFGRCGVALAILLAAGCRSTNPPAAPPPTTSVSGTPSAYHPIPRQPPPEEVARELGFADSLAAQGELRGAETALRALIRRYPLQPEPNEALGTMLLRASRFAEALPLLLRAASLRPRDSEAQVMAGLALLRTGDRERAVEFGRRAVELDSRNPSARLLLARVHAARGDARASLEAAETYVKMAENPAPGFYLLGSLHFQWSDFEKAELWLRRSLERDPSNPEALCLLGQVLRARGSGATEEALEVLRRAVALRPDYGEAHAALGRALMDRREWREAVTHLEEALRHTADRAPLYYTLSQALSRSGRREEAARMLAAYRRERRNR